MFLCVFETVGKQNHNWKNSVFVFQWILAISSIESKMYVVEDQFSFILAQKISVIVIIFFCI